MHKETTINLPLSISHPDIAKQWHTTKNGNLTPSKVTAYSRKEAIWICDKGHIEKEAIYKRARRIKKSCKSCSSLGYLKPSLLEEIHPDNQIQPLEIAANSNKKIKWQCKKCGHEWYASIANRFSCNSGCPGCSGAVATRKTSLAECYPEIAKEWDHETNIKKPEDFTTGSDEIVNWICPNGHKYSESIYNRTRRNRGCKVCKSLAYKHPDLVEEWSPQNTYPVNNIAAGSGVMAVWTCKKCKHSWKAKVIDRTNGHGCPNCNCGWTIDRMRRFILSLLPHIENASLTPAELFMLFLQGGVSSSYGKAKELASDIQSNKFSIQDLQAFATGNISVIDDFLQNNQQKDAGDLNDLETISVIETLEDHSFFDRTQTIQSKHTLEALDKITSMVSDEEAIKFLITSATQKIWQHASVSEIEALEQINAFDGGTYPQEVKRKFLQEYHGTKSIQIPKDYSFKLNGEIVRPSLMQLLTSYKVLTEKRFGNWSGTGSGKTLSAIIASRIIPSSVTVIICPNNVVPGWLKDIPQAFPVSDIFTKADINWNNRPNQRPKYLILNYDFFQQDKCRTKLEIFLKTNLVNFCVLDEIHFSKQRERTKASIRKLNISWFLQQAQTRNPNLHVLGMTATPVINNLYEGRMLLEMITGKSFENIGSKSTLNNCMLLHQKLLSLGIRIRPKYSASLSIRSIEIDGNHLVPEIKHLGKKQELQLEALLTKSKLPTLVQELRNKTIIYTQYIGAGILEMIKTAVNKAGYTFSVFTGEEKDSLDKFIDGDVAVLIASKPISTGIDGLQNVCSRIIINSLPWTSAEFEQLIGRVHRQGQIKNRVEIIVLITTISLNGKVWSWCQMRYNRIKFKRTIADAAVDGIIPDEHIQTPAQTYTYAMEWLKRLEENL